MIRQINTNTNPNYRFLVQKMNLDGSVSTIDRLGSIELDGFMAEAYGRYATLLVTEENSGRAVIYTDNGEWWDSVRATK
ncbi:MAG: hypothetical protein ACO30N_07560 [Schleiferiaceae bacterium]